MRFDYVKYDDLAMSLQGAFKAKVSELEDCIDGNLLAPRAKALALTKLEEVYMWIGKAIRDDQLARNKETELCEARTNS